MTNRQLAHRPLPPGVWRSQGQSRAAVEILTVSTAGSLEHNAQERPETSFPGVLGPYAHLSCPAERCTPRGVPSHAFHLRTQLRYVMVKGDFAIGLKEGADVGLRVTQLGRAECRELEDAEVGAVTIAGGIAERAAPADAH